MASKLKSADQKAKEKHADNPECANCPNKCNKVALEVIILNDKKTPVKDVLVSLLDGNNKMSNYSDKNGVARFEGLDEKEYEISLNKIDKNLWNISKTDVLPDNKKKSTIHIKWEPDKKSNSQTTKHVVKQGETVTSIAAEYGLDPKTIWDAEENKELRKKREYMNILAPGDTVIVPEKKVGTTKVTAGSLNTITVKDLMSVLKLQLLDSAGNKRPNISYLFSIKTKSGKVVPDRKGTTDADGFLDEPVPPDAASAKIIVNDKGNKEEYEVSIGTLDPIDTVSGLQQRLCNLGYSCEPEKNIGPSTQNALKRFQFDKGLKETGTFDNQTLNQLKSVCLC